MKQNQYQAQQLASLLQSLRSQSFSGGLLLTAQITPHQQRTRTLVLRNGNIVYGGAAIPSSEELARKIGQKFKLDSIDKALQEVKPLKLSARELLEQLVDLDELTWEQIESYVSSQVAIALEQLLPYSGFQVNTEVEFALCFGEDCHGLDLAALLAGVARRQEKWATLAPQIPSMEAVPHMSVDMEVSDQTVRQHLQKWVDGKRSLVEIAEGLDLDPLQVARSYLKWLQLHWVTFDGGGTVRAIASDMTCQERPTILSVDDSPIVQTSIKRAIGDRYNVVLADNAVDALKLLNQKPVALLLLDVTMPDMDGLEMCRTLRQIPKFSQLPVVMLTAREGQDDKLQGQAAGADHYLTKPFNAEQLLKLIEQYI